MDKKRALRNGETHVILGVGLHTNLMAETLEDFGINDYIVIDYDADEEVMELGDVYFYSPEAARRKFAREVKKNVIFHTILSRGKQR